MDDMIEKVARALCMSRHGGFPIDRESRAKDSDNWKAAWWWQAEQDARAALQALREPTEGMMQAMQIEVNLLDDPDPPNSVEFLSHDEVVSIWQAAIDHALQTQGEGE